MCVVRDVGVGQSAGTSDAAGLETRKAYVDRGHLKRLAGKLASREERVKDDAGKNQPSRSAFDVAKMAKMSVVWIKVRVVWFAACVDVVIVRK